LRNNLATLVRIVVDRRTRVRVHRGRGSRITLKAKGAATRVPDLPLATPLVARLARHDAARCWDARFGSATRNDETRFKAASE
jgi:hypothetical protein